MNNKCWKTKPPYYPVTKNSYGYMNVYKSLWVRYKLPERKKITTEVITMDCSYAKEFSFEYKYGWYITFYKGKYFIGNTSNSFDIDRLLNKEKAYSEISLAPKGFKVEFYQTPVKFVPDIKYKDIKND